MSLQKIRLKQQIKSKERKRRKITMKILKDAVFSCKARGGAALTYKLHDVNHKQVLNLKKQFPFRELHPVTVTLYCGTPDNDDMLGTHTLWLKIWDSSEKIFAKESPAPMSKRMNFNYDSNDSTCGVISIEPMFMGE